MSLWLGRKSDDSLFDMNIATFEDDAGAYDQKDAGGFIKLNALRMRIAALERAAVNRPACVRPRWRVAGFLNDIIQS
jgi:argininosuccinate synthase